MMRTLKKSRWSLVLLLVLGVTCLAWMLGMGEIVAKGFATRAIARRDYQSARIWAERARAIDSQDAEAVFLLARIARKQGRIETSFGHLKHAEALGFDRRRIHREGVLAQAQAGQLPDVVQELPKLLMDQQGDGAEICEAFTNGFLANGQDREALKLIEGWRVDYPRDALPEYLWGRLSEHHRNLSEAETHFRAALQRDPRHDMSAFGLARILCEFNRWQEASEHYRACLGNPMPGPAQVYLARCLRNLGRNDEATALLISAAKSDETEFTEELKRLGEPTENDLLATERGTLEANQGHHEEAVRWLERALQHNPKHRESRYQLAQSLNALGRSAEAQKHFKQLGETDANLREINRLHDLVLQNPDDLEARFRLGILVFENSSESAGLFWLRSVLARDPNHQGAQDALARFSAASQAIRSKTSGTSKNQTSN